ncbi:MAG: hypothetical protein QWI36_02410 [Wolbachia endosymbiont of Tyrophagus putrescentiae]|nr:hypothetical protein [Wolbachia endosymbiont of Tyrophagus putrescentiae]
MAESIFSGFFNFFSKNSSYTSDNLKKEETIITHMEVDDNAAEQTAMSTGTDSEEKANDNAVEQAAMSIETNSDDEFFDCKEKVEEAPGVEFDIFDEYEIVDSEECEEFLDCQEEFPVPQSKIVSYVIKPSLYAVKYTASALSATTMVISYTLDGTSRVVAGVSYIPHEMSKALELCKGEDKGTTGHKIVTFSQGLLNCTSATIYAASYIPYGAGIVFDGVSNTTGKVSSSLTPETIEEICKKSDLFVDDISNTANKLQEVGVNISENVASMLKGVTIQNTAATAISLS